MLHRPCLAALAAALLLVAVQGLTAARCGAEGETAPPPAPVSAPAQDDPYTVNGVDVDVTASSAAEARDKAILEAQRKAFGILFKRLASDGDTRIVPNVAESDLQRMMQGFEIEHERGSAVRYVGTLSFKFRRKPVRSYMSSLGVRVVEPAPKPPAAPAVTTGATAAPAASTTPAAPTAAAAAGDKPTVVLPVFQVGGRSLLWEERTAWRSAWEDLVAAGATKLVVPPGELADVADISAAEALAGDAAALTKIIGHYNAGDVVVVTLAVVDKLDPAVGGDVSLTRYGADALPAGTAILPATGNAGETLAAFLARAATTAVARFGSLSRPAPPPVVETRLQVGIPITGMQDWLEIRRRLTSNPMVTAVDTMSLSRSRVEVTIRFRGDQDALRAMLDRDALTLAPAPGPSGWELYLKSSVQAAPPVSAPGPVASPGPSPASVPAPMPAPMPAQVTAPLPPNAVPPRAYPPVPVGASEYYSPSDEPSPESLAPESPSPESPADDSGVVPPR